MAQRSLTDEKQAATVEQIAKRREARRRDAVRYVMADERGRLFLSEVLAECGLFRGGYQPDANRLQFDSGERNVGLRLLAELVRDTPRDYRVLEDERLIRVASDEREDDRAIKPAAEEGE